VAQLIDDQQATAWCLARYMRKYYRRNCADGLPTGYHYSTIVFSAILRRCFALTNQGSTAWRQTDWRYLSLCDQTSWDAGPIIRARNVGAYQPQTQRRRYGGGLGKDVEKMGAFPVVCAITLEEPGVGFQRYKTVVLSAERTWQGRNSTSAEEGAMLKSSKKCGELT